MFEDVHALPPGHILILERGSVRLERYWDWNFSPALEDKRSTLTEAAEQLHELLVDATRLQLRADVPVGTYLSGGLDSAIVTAIVKQITPAQLTSYSLCFEDPEFDERAFQQIMVA